MDLSTCAITTRPGWIRAPIFYQRGPHVPQFAAVVQAACFAMLENESNANLKARDCCWRPRVTIAMLSGFLDPAACRGRAFRMAKYTPGTGAGSRRS